MVVSSLQTNLPALHIVQEIRRTDARMQISLERISTGLRINNAKDDPRGLLVANRLESQFRSLNRAAQNVQEAIGMTETVMGALNEVINQLQVIRDLALSAANSGVLDPGDRLALQSDIEQRIDQIRAIAEYTRFGGNRLLDGRFESRARFAPGTRAFGGHLAFGPAAANLLSGEAFLNLAKVQEGDARVRSGGDGVFNTGIRLSSDAAVTVGQFLTGGGVSGGGDVLSGSTFNTVEMETDGRIHFNGVLANGKTMFSGSLNIGAATTVNDLIAAIQASIDAAEAEIGVHSPGGTGALETNVTIDANGRLVFSSGAAGTPSQFDLRLTVQNAAGVTQTQTSVTRSQAIHHSELGADATGALIGNSLTAITGSTFSSGQFDIEVFNVLQAEQRRLTADRSFFTNVSLTMPVTGGSLLSDAFFGEIDIQDGDVIEFSGVDLDGTTFSTSFTVTGAANNPGDGLIQTFDDLIAELNFRDRSAVSSGFNGATATLVNGALRIIDDIAQASQTDFSFTVISNASPGLTETSDPSMDVAGRAETASFRIGDGPAVQARAGEIITLTGSPQHAADGQAPPELTIRVGRNFSAGIDRISITAEIYEGKLDGGPAVQFQQGQKGVTFFSGKFTTSSLGRQQFITMDFDSILDIPARPQDGGETFKLESTSRSLQFRMGTHPNEDLLFLLADIRPERLGLSEDRSLASIQVMTLSGANDALEIVDAALAQVNLLNSLVGAFSSRLESSVDHLSRNAADIEVSHTRLVSTNLFEETARLARNTLLLEAQTAVLAQANLTPDRVFRILYGLDGR